MEEVKELLRFQPPLQIRLLVSAIVSVHLIYTSSFVLFFNKYDKEFPVEDIEMRNRKQFEKAIP